MVSGVNVPDTVHIPTFKRVLVRDAWIENSKESTVLAFVSH